MYLLICTLHEPDFILTAPYFIKPLESRLSHAVLGKIKIFSVFLIHILLRPSAPSLCFLVSLVSEFSIVTS